MKNILTLLCCLLLLFSMSVSMFSEGLDFILTEIPMLMYVSTGSEVKGGLNVVSAGLDFTFMDAFKTQVVFKDTYMYLIAGTNRIIESNIIINTNKYQLDKAFLSYKTPELQFLIGRSVYKEGDGMLLSNPGDGFFLQTSFFKMKQKATVMYTGLLTDDLDKFKLSADDRLNGSQRVIGSTVLENTGFLGLNNITLESLYIKDLNPSNTNSVYDPLYFRLSASDLLFTGFTYNASVVYQMTPNLLLDPLGLSNTGEGYTYKKVSAFAGNFNILYSILKKEPKIAFQTKISASSGQLTNALTTTSFHTFGSFPVGKVLSPKFHNILSVQTGLVNRFFDGKFTLMTDYFFLMRILTEDSFSGYYTGEGRIIGHELSGTVSIGIDPNITFFSTGGAFMRGDAFTNSGDMLYKVSGGLNFKF